MWLSCYGNELKVFDARQLAGRRVLRFVFGNGLVAYCVAVYGAIDAATTVLLAALSVSRGRMV